MNWNFLFSLPKRKKLQKQLVDQLNQPDSQIDAGQVTGGTPSGGPDTGDIGWRKEEVSNELKR